LAAIGVRIEAPIPGKPAIGIEIPNKETEPVLLRGIIESEAFKKAESNLTAGIGRDIQRDMKILCRFRKNATFANSRSHRIREISLY